MAEAIKYIKYSRLVHVMLGARLPELEMAVRRTWQALPRPPDGEADGVTFATWIGFKGNFQTGKMPEDDLFAVVGERDHPGEPWQFYVYKAEWRTVPCPTDGVMFDMGGKPVEEGSRTFKMIEACDDEENRVFQSGEESDIKGLA